MNSILASTPGYHYNDVRTIIANTTTSFQVSLVWKSFSLHVNSILASTTGYNYNDVGTVVANITNSFQLSLD